jgi:hypothetical protein
MNPKKTISAHVLMVGIVTLLIVGSFVAYQIYSALTKTQVSELQEKAIKPLDGSIKNEVINNLSGRRWFNRAELDRPIFTNPPVEEVAEIGGVTVENENPQEATETGKVEEE